MMKTLKNIINKFPLGIRLFIREQLGLKNPIKLNLLKVNLRNEFSIFEEQNVGLKIKDGSETWYKSFKKFIKAQPEESEVAFEFFKDSISVLKLSNLEKENVKVILVCVVKNDLLKIKNLVKHHRRIGVKHFAILDNGSSDGTVEWLKDQNDVDLFLVQDKYTTNRREAWVNKIIAYYGFKRWYLILDSDELFAFHKMESKNIEYLINYCEKHSIDRMRAVMIDMYGSDSFYSENQEGDYLEKCKYFDLNSYKHENRDIIDLITGGPRSRIFNQRPWLTKYPLCYFVEGDIQGKSHYLFPYKKNKNTKCYSAILHYKFLPSDFKKYRNIATEGNYFNGSIQYKDYINHLDNSNGLSFMDERSVEYSDSDSLYMIPILDKINFDE
ncbi:glycosyltransferase family 2 protein [Paenibacillus sp. JSM ZJ436]|uniref:glycosyltransferase family 2 protein n=1 Tax=Paenibacillus sp. JSM ZJ436 TaxID=3376190 RepID=UPI0037A8B261